jgi:membrane-bound lytic murein transglycosylase B
MKNALLVMAALAFATAPIPALAKGAPPSAAQKAEFLATCLKVAPEAQALCTCKADAAMSLIDSAFIDVVIASMKGKPVEAQHYSAYNDYIARSTQACGMGM